MNNKFLQAGFFTPKMMMVMAAVAVPVVVVSAFLILGALNNGEEGGESGVTQEVVLVDLISEVDKSNSDWMREYCLEKAAMLPDASFTFETRDVPYVGSPAPPLTKLLPVDKRFKSKSCSVAFPFDSEEAYSSKGVDYRPDIKATRDFQSRVYKSYISSVLGMEPGWEVVSTEDVAPIFKRDNAVLDTVEYIQAFFGIPFYVKLTVYEK